MSAGPEVSWDQLDWRILDRLRDKFLSGEAAAGPYWETEADLAHYDLTYAERIGWKWDHVLRELTQRRWVPATGALVDWGCGSGIAHRRVANRWPTQVESIEVIDHSRLAEQYSLNRIHHLYPDLPRRSWDRKTTPATLVVSHVLNELSGDDAADLMSALRQATTVIWVEPGTADVAAQLVKWREQLRDTFHIVYPCPHQALCGLLVPGNERHWCHHFANPPGEVGADSNWVKFGQRAGIDLRSLPYSALVLDRRPLENNPSPSAMMPGRIIGRPKVAKPFARFLGCDAAGASMLQLPKKLAPALVKKLDRPGSPRLLRWQRDGEIVTRVDVSTRSDEERPS